MLLDLLCSTLHTNEGYKPHIIHYQDLTKEITFLLLNTISFIMLHSTDQRRV